MKKQRIYIILGIAFLLGSVLLSLWYMAEERRADIHSESVLEHLKEEMDSEGVCPEGTARQGYLTSEMEQVDLADFFYLHQGEEMPTVSMDGDTYVGYIIIPSLSLEIPVMAGDCNEDCLKKSPCRFCGSVYTNDMVIAGHNYRKHFSRVKALEEGAEIDFLDVKGRVFCYELAWTEILGPEAVEELTEAGAKDRWQLTLFTCTTGGQHRYVVRCRLKELYEHKA